MSSMMKLVAGATVAVLVASAQAQVAPEAKQVLTEAAQAMKQYEGVTFKSKRSATGMLKEIIDLDGSVKIWRPKGATSPWIMLEGRVKEPGKPDKKQTSIYNGKTVTWLDWKTNTLMERPVGDQGSVSELNIMKQLVPEEYFGTATPFAKELTEWPKLSRLPAEAVGGEPTDVVESRPADDSRNFTWYISVKDRLPRKLVMGMGSQKVDLQMITEFTEVKTDAKLSESDFKITLPPGFVEDRKAEVAAPKPQAAAPTEMAPVPPPTLGLKPGTPAPAFNVTDSTGKAHSLTDFTGKVVVLEFFGTMFKPSLAPAADMKALAAEHGGKGVVFVGLACRELNEGAAAKHWASAGLSYPLVPKGDAVAADYKVAGYPSYYVINPAGQIAAFFQDFPGKDALAAAITEAGKK